MNEAANRAMKFIAFKMSLNPENLRRDDSLVP
jgi:hypothetical protein